MILSCRVWWTVRLPNIFCVGSANKSNNFVSGKRVGRWAQAKVILDRGAAVSCGCFGPQSHDFHGVPDLLVPSKLVHYSEFFRVQRLYAGRLQFWNSASSTAQCFRAFMGYQDPTLGSKEVLWFCVVIICNTAFGRVELGGQAVFRLIPLWDLHKRGTGRSSILTSWADVSEIRPF